MILPRFGKWSSSSGIWFVWDRIYRKARWTPFCRVRWRYPHNRFRGFWLQEWLRVWCAVEDPEGHDLASLFVVLRPLGSGERDGAGYEGWVRLPSVGYDREILRIRSRWFVSDFVDPLSVPEGAVVNLRLELTPPEALKLRRPPVRSDSLK